MSVDPAPNGAATTGGGASYLPGDGVAVVTPDSVLLLPPGDHDVARLHAEVRRATDARAVLAAGVGGNVLDLDALPDLALAHRGPAGVRVLLSGRMRCTVMEGGSITELDGAETALLGEWGFAAGVTVELFAPGAAEGEPGWPVSSAVVPADRVRWAAGPVRAGRGMETVSSSSPSARRPATTPPTPIPSPSRTPAATRAVTPTSTRAGAEAAARAPTRAGVDTSAAAGAEATLIPEWTDDPGAASPPIAPDPGRTPPGPAPAPVPAAPPGPPPTAVPAADRGPTTSGDRDDIEIDEVEYTVGGGINYARVFSSAGADGSTSAPPAATPSFPTPPPDTPPPTSPSPAAPGPTGADAAAPDRPRIAPDLSGDTVSPEQAASLRAAMAGATGRAPDAETSSETATAARLCPQNHPNPPQQSACRICQAPLDGPTVRITRPSLGTVRLSTGMFFELDRPLLLGREPRIDGVDADAAPRLIVLPSPEKSISRCHLRVDIDGWSVHAVDLGSTNGTYLRRGAADEVRLMPDEPKMLMSGDILVVDDVRIRFEDLP